MTDLIGKFLSFEENMGRGLVKFGYYLALVFIVLISLYQLIKFLFGGDFGSFFLVPFHFALHIVLLRIGTELALAILSIDDSLKGSKDTPSVTEAGITPAPGTTAHDVPQDAPVPPKPESDTTTPDGETPSS